MPKIEQGMKQETCCAKIGMPNIFTGMHVCNKPVEWVAAMGVGTYSGWYHTDRSLSANHSAVPGSYAR